MSNREKWQGKDARGCEVCGEQTPLACGKTIMGRECWTPLCNDCECPSEDAHVSNEKEADTEWATATGGSVR